jgi:hypothetical protein
MKVGFYRRRKQESHMKVGFYRRRKQESYMKVVSGGCRK